MNKDDVNISYNCLMEVSWEKDINTGTKIHDVFSVGKQIITL